MATEVLVPTLGESITEATLGEWLKQPGDAVAADEPIASLETDKVSVEVPSPVAGVMGEHAVKVGDTVSEGTVVVVVGGDGAGPLTTPPSLVGQQEPEPETTPGSPAPAPAPAAQAPSAPPAAGSGRYPWWASMAATVARTAAWSSTTSTTAPSVAPS